MLTLTPASDNSLREATYATSELLMFFSREYITSETPDCKPSISSWQHINKHITRANELLDHLDNYLGTFIAWIHSHIKALQTQMHIKARMGIEAKIDED